jgi:hypothetical protein
LEVEVPFDEFFKALKRFLAEHWRACVATVFVLLFLGWMAGAYPTPGEPLSARYRAEATTAGLHIVSWVRIDQAVPGEPFTVRYAVTNGTPRPIRLRSALFEAPGFELPPHRDHEVLAGGSVIVREDLIPRRRSGAAMITALFTWRDAAGALQKQAVALGPVRFTSSLLEALSNAAATLLSLLKTLALPVVLAMLGYILQQRQQDLVQERQAWASMLPVSHENNTKFYIPMLGGIRAFGTRLKEFAKDPTKNDLCKQACFFLLFTFRRMREMEKKGSGFYLMDRTGEELVASCWDAFWDRMRIELHPYEDVSALLDAMGPNESTSSHKEKMKAAGLEDKVQEVEDRFARWAKGSKAKDFSLLLLFSVLLEFELNRIYKFWYGSEPTFPTRAFAELLSDLRSDFPGLSAAVETYVAKFG